jgi:Rrf2 family protein
MKLSTRGKYGLYAMIYLAQHHGEGPQALKAIAEVGTPEAYLEQLLGALRRAELVNAVRGAQGGYLLSREPEKITLRNIVEAMEGPISFSDCVSSPESACARSGDCPAKGVWEYLTGEVNSLLDKITLRDMVDQNLHHTV